MWFKTRNSSLPDLQVDVLRSLFSTWQRYSGQSVQGLACSPLLPLQLQLLPAMQLITWINYNCGRNRTPHQRATRLRQCAIVLRLSDGRARKQWHCPATLRQRCLLSCSINPAYSLLGWVCLKLSAVCARAAGGLSLG